MNERVRQIRAHFHMTQKELAKTMGVSAGFISLVETGRSGLSEENIESLCKSLHISAYWLRDGTGVMESDHPEDWSFGASDEEMRKARADATAGRIRELRQHLHLTQKEFATKMGSSREVVAMVEQCRNRASESLLNKIENGYAVRRQWLRDGTGEMFPIESEPSAGEEEGQDSISEKADCGQQDKCEECGEPVRDDWTYECLEYTFPYSSVYPAYHDEPQWNTRKGYLIINHIPCRRCEQCRAEYYSEETEKKLDQMIDDLFPVIGLGKGFESPGRPGASVGDVIIQSFM